MIKDNVYFQESLPQCTSCDETVSHKLTQVQNLNNKLDKRDVLIGFTNKEM